MRSAPSIEKLFISPSPEVPCSLVAPAGKKVHGVRQKKKWGREGAGWAEEFTKKFKQSQRVTWLSVLAAPRIATDAHKPANEPKQNIIE